LFKKTDTFFPNKEEHYQQLEETKKTALLIINRCHKFIAHNDKKAIFSTKKEEIYLLDLTKTLDTLAEFMNHLNNYYYDTTSGYNRLIIRADRNARSILIQLEKARRYDQWLKEQPNQHEIYDEIVELIDAKPEES